MVWVDLAPVQVEVEHNGRPYCLREATPAAYAAYKNAKARSARFEDGKFVGVGDVVEAEQVLVSMCLHQLEEDGSPKMSGGARPVALTVPLATIKTWNQNFIEKLAEKAKEISHIVEKTGETEESLEKDVEEAQRKLDDFRARKGEGAEKNGRCATTTSCA
jgi:hypothetical protein